MPLYEYRCEECGTKFEKVVNISSSDQPQECPICKEDSCHRLISTFATMGRSVTSQTASSCGSSGSRFT